jgi:hypothetical protein
MTHDTHVHGFEACPRAAVSAATEGMPSSATAPWSAAPAAAEEDEAGTAVVRPEVARSRPEMVRGAARAEPWVEETAGAFAKEEVRVARSMTEDASDPRLLRMEFIERGGI